MLRAGFSLVGLEGVLMPTFPNAPEGCATVQIDWKAAGYDEEKYDDLPPFINVPIAHLEIVEAEIARPVLGFVSLESATAGEEKKTQLETAPGSHENISSQTDSSQNDSDDERPRLRLV